MNKLVKNILIAFAVLFIISGVFGIFQDKLLVRTPNISISALVGKIKDGQVDRVIIEGAELEAELKDGTSVRSKKELGVSFAEEAQNYGLTSEELSRIAVEIKEPSGLAYWLGVVLPIVLPFLLIVGLFWFLMRQARAGSMQAFTFGRTTARVATPKEKITFNDVAGLVEAKEELKEVVEFLKNPKKFIEIGARIPRGVLLIGPPGSGKTLIARAVAGEANVPFYHISGSEFVEMFVGVGASRVRDTFAVAKRNSPAILFVDEIDAIGRHRGSGFGGGNDEREQTLNQILVEMDGFDRNTNVIVTAATNRPDVLDAALLRPGRFDRRIMLDQPDIKARQDILELHARGVKVDGSVSMRAIAERTPGFSGADLANLVNEAAILAARQDKKVISQEDLLESIEKVLLGPERKSHLFSTKEKEIAAYHEAGHALVAASMGHSDPVHKISIVSRGRAGGYTLKLPSEERRLHTRSMFLADLAVMLGGYVAELMVFKELTTGPCNDLAKANELARKMVVEYGMSRLGPVTYASNEGISGTGYDSVEPRQYSEEVAAKIDREVKDLIDVAHKTADKIITERRDKLNVIAKRLVEKEVIEKEEFEELMGGKTNMRPRSGKILAKSVPASQLPLRRADDKMKPNMRLKPTRG